MERFVQTLDDLEDLIYAFALKWERIHRACRFALFVLTAAVLQVLAIALAHSYPPLGTAIIALLLVSLLYQSVVGRRTSILPAA